MMGSGMMDGWRWVMMGGFGLMMILVLVLVVLGIVALLKFLAAGCKFACNNDPLRGENRVQFRPL